MNEEENNILDGLDYADKDNVALAALFYQHLSEMDEGFLTDNNYSKEEVLDGMKRLVQEAGYPNMIDSEFL